MITKGCEGTDTQGMLAMLEASALRARKIAEADLDEDAGAESTAQAAEAMLTLMRNDLDPEGWHVLVSNWGTMVPGHLAGESRSLWAVKVRGEEKPQSLLLDCTRKTFQAHVGHMIMQFVPARALEMETTGDTHVAAVKRVFKREFEAAQAHVTDGHLVIKIPVSEAATLRRRLGA